MGERERNLFWRKILKLFADPGYIGHVCLWRPLLPWKTTVGAKIFEMVSGVFTELPLNGNI